ncbi:outer membrane protein assembly factor BamB family protein [Natronococcus pandeyae]|nr:PQQ-binding-like beta-propeller repeat protein [Natronococcus pandeyae]
MTTGATLATGSLLASIGAATEGDRPLLEEPAGWSSYDGNARNTRSRPSMSSIEAPETIAWQYDENGSPVIVDGTVYLQTNGEVHALDADDGSQLWTSSDVGASETPAVAKDAVYTAGSKLTALSTETGGVQWSVELDVEESVTSPTVAFETVYVIVDGTLRAFDAADGTPRWERDTMDVAYSPPGDDSSSDYSYGFSTDDGAIAASNATVWALLDERRNGGIPGTDALAAIDPLTGEAQWTEHLELGTVADGLTAIEGTLFIENGVGEEVVVFDTESRERKRTISDAFVTAATEDAVVTRGRNGLEVTMSGSSWSEETVDGFGAPVIVGDTIVVGYTADTQKPDMIRGLDLEDGTERWRLEFDERQWMSGFGVEVIVGDDIICIDRAEGLTALRSADEGDANDEEEAEEDEDEADDNETGDEDGDETENDGDETENDGEEGDDETGEEETDDGDETENDDGGESENDNEESENDGDESETDDGAGETDDTAEETSDEPDDESYESGEETDGDEADEGEAADEDGDSGSSGGDEHQDDESGNGGTDDDGTSGEDDSETGGEDDSEIQDDDEIEEDDEEPETADEADNDGAAADDGTDDPDEMPGFTTGAGIAGGAIGLEWLRRRAQDIG